MDFSSEQDWFDAGQFTKIPQYGIQVSAVAEAGILVGPILNQRIYIAMNRNKSMRPKRDSTFVETAFDLISGRLEYTAARDSHLKYSIHSSQPGENAFANFANQLHGNATRFTFCGDSVRGEARRA